MPHVTVKLWPGKTEQQKTRLAEAITKDIIDILQYGEHQSQWQWKKSVHRSGSRRSTDPRSRTIWTSFTRSLDTMRKTCESLPKNGGRQRTGTKLITAAVNSILLFASAASQAQTAPAQVRVAPTARSIEITRSGSQQPSRAPAEHFTGSVMIEPVFFAHDPSRASARKIRFEPGARSAWHTHPLGQILIVTDGMGWIQEWGGPIEEIRKGDVIWIPAGVKHWHGATPTTAMTHIAIQEQLNGKVVEWMEKLSDEQYRK